MSRFSSSKRLQSDIAIHEENSDRRIPPDMYYIVMITLCEDQTDGTSKISMIVKDWLKTKTEHQALVAYIYRNEIYLVFSSVENSEHYLSGSHHTLCSEYASLAALAFGCKTNVKLIELESRTLILLYFQMKIFENAKKSVHQLSKNSITKKEIATLTFAELIQLLQTRSSTSWEKVAPIERFGVFYKYAITDDQKEKFLVMSEMINIQDQDRYTSYLFD